MDTPSELPTGFHLCNQPNTALWSTILCFGTFAIAVVLRKFRQSRFLGKQVYISLAQNYIIFIKLFVNFCAHFSKGRRLVSDFGMLTAISTMVVVSVLIRYVVAAVAVETIVVPNGYLLTNSTGRGWIVNPVEGLTVWEILGASVPASLVSDLHSFISLVIVFSLWCPSWVCSYL